MLITRRFLFQDFLLHSTLSEFKCEDKCPYGQAGAVHPISARRHCRKFNVAATPQPLAEEVAQHVDSELYRHHIRYLEEVTMTPEEIVEFIAAMSKNAKKQTGSTAAASVDGTADTTTEAGASAVGSEEDATMETEASPSSKCSSPAMSG